MAIAQITGHEPLPNKDAAGRTIVETLVTYRLEDGKQHAILIKKDKPTKDDILREIKKDIDDRSQIVGTQFNV